MVGPLLVIGGYGAVGHRAAAHLAEIFPNTVAVAGHDGEKAKRVAEAIGHGARGIGVDASNLNDLTRAVSAHETIVNTVEALEADVLDAACAAGHNYVGVIGTDLQPLRKRHEWAVERGTRALLGTGVMPGISNVMARSLYDELGGADRIVTVAIGSVGSLGARSLDYLLREAAKPFELRDRQGQSRNVFSYEVPVPFEFPPAVGFATAHAIRDYFCYPDTLDCDSITAMSIEPALLRYAMHLSAVLGLSRAMVNDGVRNGIVKALLAIGQRTPTDRMVIGVEAQRGDKGARLIASGDDTVAWTAQGVATLAAAVHNREVGPGVWLPEETIPADSYLQEVKNRGLKLTRMVF